MHLQTCDIAVLTCHLVQLVELGLGVELCLFPAVRPVLILARVQSDSTKY